MGNCIPKAIDDDTRDAGWGCAAAALDGTGNISLVDTLLWVEGQLQYICG